MERRPAADYNIIKADIKEVNETSRYRLLLLEDNRGLRRCDLLLEHDSEYPFDGTSDLNSITFCPCFVAVHCFVDLLLTFGRSAFH